TYETFATSRPVILGDDRSIPALGIGNVEIRTYADGRANDVTLRQVLHVPDIGSNLLSVLNLSRGGADTRFNKDGCFISDEHGTFCEGRVRDNLYVVRARTRL
ncbi:hypothetical protein PENSPDRAFT_537204, partial [Peniophora sp. CONT]